MRAVARRLRVVPVSLWIAMGFFVICAIFVPRFFTSGNLENVVRIASILAIVSCGQAIVLVLGGIEFSFGSSVALASVVAVMLMPDFGPLAGFAGAVLTVLAVSAVNATLVAFLGLPAVIVTLGALMIGHGLAASLVGGLPIEAVPSELFKWPSTGSLFGVSAPVVLAALAIVTLSIILNFTHIGRRLFLVGASPNAARISGISVSRAKFAGYLMAGGFCAVAAVVLTSRVASGQPNLMPNLPFETIAACAIGGIPLSGGRGSAIQVLAGVAVIAMLNNAVVLLNYPAAVQQLLIAAVIIGSVVAQKTRFSVLVGAAPERAGGRK